MTSDTLRYAPAPGRFDEVIDADDVHIQVADDEITLGMVETLIGSGGVCLQFGDCAVEHLLSLGLRRANLGLATPLGHSGRGPQRRGKGKNKKPDAQQARD